MRRAEATSLLRRIGIEIETEHAVIADGRSLELETGLPQQGDIAPERSHRDAESVPIVRDGHRPASGK
jgi:hypothetical protein